MMIKYLNEPESTTVILRVLVLPGRKLLLTLKKILNALRILS